MMKRLLLLLCFLAGAANLAFAHFVFVTPEDGGATARTFISENLTPDLGVKLIAGTKLSLRDASGAEFPLAIEGGEANFFIVALPGSGTRVVHGTTDLGVMTRGGKAHRLIYYPKAIVGDPFDEKARVGGETPVEIIPTGRTGAMKFQLIARGNPQANAEITVILPDGTEKKTKTDSAGKTEEFAAIGRYGAWARYWESTPGELDGKKYEELRHYATLVVDAGATERSSAASSNTVPYTKLPQATASFGAAVAGDWLYVYGGHISPTHSYFKEAVSGRFDRLKLSGEPNWESLPEGPRMQGMNIAAHKGKVYRVGGMVPHNERGQPADNHSVSDAARFDPVKKQWEQLPALPAPRSSHDVVVVGDKLFVIGGWTMEGKTQTWRDTVEILDLAAQTPTWRSVPQPFQRRALMAAPLDGKIYVIGGMNEKQKVVSDVSIYDPKTNQWSEGPGLPAGTNLGFAPAVGVHEGRLYVSVSDGSLLCLNPAANAWEKVAAAAPRVAHRLASRGDSVLLIGGAAKGKNLDSVDAINVSK